MAGRAVCRQDTAPQAAISAAANRLLAGTPLRSSGKLTVSALITESGLRRDVAYEYAARIDEFKARVKAQQTTPLAMQQLADEYAEATPQITALKGRTVSGARRRSAASQGDRRTVARTPASPRRAGRHAECHRP